MRVDERKRLEGATLALRFFTVPEKWFCILYFSCKNRA
jgi:hypothetical protein